MLPTIPTTTGDPSERTHYTAAELDEMTLREMRTVYVQTPQVWRRSVEALDSDPPPFTAAKLAEITLREIAAVRTQRPLRVLNESTALPR